MSYADFVAFRKSLPRTPRLERQTVRARGVDFAVFSSPPVEASPPLLCINLQRISEDVDGVESNFASKLNPASRIDGSSQPCGINKPKLQMAILLYYAP